MRVSIGDEVILLLLIQGAVKVQDEADQLLGVHFLTGSVGK